MARSGHRIPLLTLVATLAVALGSVVPASGQDTERIVSRMLTMWAVEKPASLRLERVASRQFTMYSTNRPVTGVDLTRVFSRQFTMYSTNRPVTGVDFTRVFSRQFTMYSTNRPLADLGLQRIVSRQFTVFSPSSDLAVTAISTQPSAGFPGTSFTLKWKITNAGDGTARGPWVDRIWISPERQPGGSRIDVPYDGPDLGSLESIERETILTFPNQHQEFWIVVETDADAFLVDSNRENNRRVDDMPISVQPPLEADLTVSVETPTAELLAGTQVDLDFTVTNNSVNPTSVSDWRDSIFLVASPILQKRLADEPYFLGQFNNPLVLFPGESYLHRVAVTLPERVEGIFHFAVYADSRQQGSWHLGEVHDQPEIDETNNVGFSDPVGISISPFQPDLVASTIGFLSPRPSSFSFSVSWRDMNIGTGTTGPEGWTDSVYVSRDAEPTIGADDRLLGVVSHSGQGALEEGESVDKVFTVVLPADLIDEYYVKIAVDTPVDSGGSIFEHGLGEGGIPREENNVTVSAATLNVIPTETVDLFPTRVEVPGTVLRGYEFEVHWSVDNIGAQPSELALVWEDGFYLSTDETFNPNEDIRLGGFYRSTTRLDGTLRLDDYSQSGLLRVNSSVPAGPYNILLVADSEDRVFEGFSAAGSGLDEHNNVFVSGQVQVFDPPTDLVVDVDFDDNHRLPVGGAPGRPISISWRVTNDADVETPVGVWRDRVRFSNDSTPSADDFTLTVASNNNVLAARGSTTFDRVVTVPPVSPGSYWLLVETDIDNAVLEPNGEDNNLAVWEFVVTADGADLVVLDVKAPDTAQAGESIAVEWTVENGGTLATEENYWQDRVYLSRDGVLDDGDVFLGAVAHGDFLEDTGSYDVTVNLGIPGDLGLSGPYSILVETDGQAPGEVFELIETNNVLATEMVVDVDELLLPNLVVSNLVVTGTVASGQTIAVSWTVTNEGSGTTTSDGWFDSVYLSRDQMLDRDSDLFIGSRSYEGGALESGGTYDGEKVFDLPFGVSGPYFIFAIPDGGAENFGAVTIDSREDPLEVSLPPPTDIVVSEVTAPDVATLGDEAVIRWRVTNVGDAPVSGRWFDAVYLSSDSMFDFDDRLIGVFESTLDAPLAPGATTSELSAEGQIVGVTPGDYRVFVRTDVRNQIPEVNEQNNLSEVASTVIEVTATPLVLDGDVVDDTLVSGSETYFALETPAGATVRVTLEHESALTALFARLGEVPTGGEFDVRSRQVGDSTQTVTIPDTIAGTYFILARAMPSTGGAAMSIHARSLPFQIESFEPKLVGDSGRVTLTIQGARFESGARVRLEAGDGGQSVMSRLVTVFDSTRLRATFLMAGERHGDYDVIVENPDNALARAADPITVESTAPPVLTVVQSDPPALREGAAAGTMAVEVGNFGNIDADYVFFLNAIEAVEHRELIDVRSSSGMTHNIARSGALLGSALHRSLAPGERTTFSLRARAGVGSEGDIAVGQAAVLFSTEKFIESQIAAAESVRQAVLQDGALLAVAVREQYLALAADSARWEVFWFEGLIAEGVVSEVDYRDFAPPAGLVSGLTRCVKRTQAGHEVPNFCTAFGSTLCQEWLARSVELGAEASAAFAMSPADRATVALSCDVDSLVACTLCTFWPVLRSVDPNEKTGGEGTGDEGLVPGGKSLRYRVYFENKPTATAPASSVEIRDSLDPALNSGSFRVGNIAFGDTVIEVPEDLVFFQKKVALEDELFVVVTGGIDTRGNEAFWTFETIDSNTGLPPTDGSLGFLPPTDESGRGLGWVEFSVKPKPDGIAKKKIRNEARITFDRNETLITNVVESTVDGDVPSTAIDSLPERVEGSTVELNWGRGGLGSSADVASYTIYASVDGGPFVPVIVSTRATSGMIPIQAGRTYAFYSLATDHAGNEEPAPPVADTETTVAGAGALFRRGDSNSDGRVDISDPLFSLRFLFQGQSPPECFDTVDVNDDGDMNISDPVGLLMFLFRAGVEPRAPGPNTCGNDPTADDLGECEDLEEVCG